MAKKKSGGTNNNAAAAAKAFNGNAQKADPLGSYSGKAKKNEKPVQDADDL